MSATLDSRKLAETLQIPLLESVGRQYPVDLRYCEGTDLYALPSAISSVIGDALAGGDGDILAFLPGQGEIKKTEKILRTRYPDLAILPLYGQLPFGRQQAVLLPHPEGKRKIVLATAIAETSLTIEGIRTVVDGGFMRSSRYNPNSGLNRLETLPVTQDTATQRAGRAGRLGPGSCYRLWTRATQDKLLPFREPEILQTDLASLVLELHKWGISDHRELDWITPPPQGHWEEAVSTLEHLGALDSGKITPHGKAIHAFPCHPRIAHLLVFSQELKLAGLATDLAAVLEEKDPLPPDKGLDINLRIEGLRRFRQSNGKKQEFRKIEKAAQSFRQLIGIEPVNGPVDPYQTGLLLAQAFPERIAFAKPGNPGLFQLANGKMARMERRDELSRESWLAIAQVNERDRTGKIFLASPLSPTDLRPMVKVRPKIYWDSQEEAVQAVEEWKIGQILLQKKPIHSPDPEAIWQALLEALCQSGEKWLPFDETVVQWQNRILSLRAWNPDAGWPDVRTDLLLARIETWLGPYLHGLRTASDLKKLRLLEILQQSLSYSQQSEADKRAPERIQLPSGSWVRIRYFSSGEPPVLAARLQELFGWKRTPRINGGSVPLLLHLLSPGYKPVQVTQDLENFWNHTYHEVKKELKRRYPKHLWPENPWEAEAITGVPRRK
ncbi:ATP-dependent helicase HrpB [Cyclobacterium xiamenense]|uniref:ATP-dependent helicase HrpB n=1 Tax=Cyclobacterium xiamenense TaxID=1297121 RepID=UPI0035D12E6A